MSSDINPRNGSADEGNRVTGNKFSVSSFVCIPPSWVFPKYSRTWSEFSEFSESDKSLKHELGSTSESWTD